MEGIPPQQKAAAPARGAVGAAIPVRDPAPPSHRAGVVGATSHVSITKEA